MSNVNEKSMLIKFNEILGDSNNKLMLLKGRLLNITKEFKVDSDEDYYYTAELKVMQENTEGYNSAFDMFHLVFPAAVSMIMTDADLKEMKNNEVLALITPNCRVKTVKGNKPDENGEVRDIKYNNSSFFVADIMKTKDVEKREVRSSYTYKL